MFQFWRTCILWRRPNYRRVCPWDFDKLNLGKIHHLCLLILTRATSPRRFLLAGVEELHARVSDEAFARDEVLLQVRFRCVATPR